MHLDAVVHMFCAYSIIVVYSFRVGMESCIDVLFVSIIGQVAKVLTNLDL